MPHYTCTLANHNQQDTKKKKNCPRVSHILSQYMGYCCITSERSYIFKGSHLRFSREERLNTFAK